MRSFIRKAFSVLLLAFVILAFANGVVFAEEIKEVIISAQPFAENNMTGTGLGRGRNLLEDIKRELGIEVKLNLVASTQEAQEMLFRLGSLPESEEDLIYVLHSFADERIVNLLTPLDDYLEEKPLDGFPEDYPEGTLGTFRKHDSLYAIPIRSGVWCIWYNKKIFEERGIKEPPCTPEELYEAAKQCTYTKPNGEKVFGFVSRGTRWDLHEQLAIGARMFGGDLIAPDYKIIINQPPVIKALDLYRKMYEEGIMPPNWNTLSGADADQYLKDGRAAIVLSSANYNMRYNDPKVSREAGNIVPAYIPLEKNLWSGEKTFSDSISFTWALSILKGSKRKDLAWDVIHYLTLKDSAIEMAKNENAPARISVLEWQAKEMKDLGAQIAIDIFKYTRPALPPLEKGNQIIDVIGEHMENVIIKGCSAQEEMDLAAKTIEELMK